MDIQKKCHILRKNAPARARSSLEGAKLKSRAKKEPKIWVWQFLTFAWKTTWIQTIQRKKGICIFRSAFCGPSHMDVWTNTFGYAMPRKQIAYASRNDLVVQKKVPEINLTLLWTCLSDNSMYMPSAWLQIFHWRSNLVHLHTSPKHNHFLLWTSSMHTQTNEPKMTSPREKQPKLKA